MNKRLVLAVVIAALALALPATAMAAGPEDTKVIMGSSYTLLTGETLDSDLLVLGGNADLEAGSLVIGSVFVLGGNINIAGEVTGDLGVLGGNVDLASTAVVRGGVGSVGGNIDRASGAVIEGDVSPNFGLDIDAPVPGFPTGIRIPAMPNFFSVSPLISGLWFLFRVLVLAGLAALVVMFWPEPIQRVADAAIGQPLPAGGLGLLTVIAGPVLLLVLLITILLAPLTLVGFVLGVAAVAFGWIALGYEVGRRFVEAMKAEMPEPVVAALGTLLLSLVAGGIGFIPCVGFLLVLVVISLGLGAVMLTRFGSQPYLGAVKASVPAPVEPEASPAPKKRSSKKVADK
jgi:hypothetical protein